MPWLNEHWTKIKSGSQKAYVGARERIRTIKFERPSNTILVWTGSILGTFLVAFVTLNILLANPRTGTPMVNWAIGTFGDKAARVQTGHLEHPFSNKFVLRTLSWPGTVRAREIDVHYDLFGWLPGRVWANEIRMLDGEILIASKKDDEPEGTFNPQQWVNRINATNVDIRFAVNDEQRTINIVTALGSFADGSVAAEAVSGSNRITFDGLHRDWGGSLKGQVTARGDNLKDLASIVGASAPDTPPFNLKGELSMQPQAFTVENLSGRMGDSDLGGLVKVSLGQEKPFLTVALKSNNLDFDDLGVVFGIPVGTGAGETTNVEQEKAKEIYDRSARLIPDARIDFTRLAAVNADIDFEAAKVVDGPIGINAITLKGTLRDSILDFEQALVKSGSGDLDAKIRIDAQKDPADTRATGTLSNVAITRIIPTDMIRGTMQGRFALNFTGSGFRDAVASANGEAGLWSNNSELSKFATEGAGLDIGEIFLLWATEDKDDPEFIKSRCLAANVAFKNGLATLQPAVIDNKDSLIAASGHVDLKNESIDIEVYARPHDVSIGTISGDIKVGGTLRNPSFEALNEETLLQAGIAGLLASVTGALGILPFVQTGGEPDAPCATLLADAKETNTRRNPAANVDPKKS